MGMCAPIWARLTESSISIHLHTAQVVPVHDLIEEHEKHGAGDFRVSWEVEVV